MGASHDVAVKVMRNLRSKLISGLTDDVDAVYDKAMSGSLVGAPSVAPDKKGRARDLVAAIIDRVEADTTFDPSPLDVFMTILHSQSNLEYLAKEIGRNLTNLERSQSADYHAQSRDLATNSYPGLGAGCCDPHNFQHETHTFASNAHATQSHSLFYLEEDKQKHALHQEPIPVAEASSPTVVEDGSKIVKDEDQEKKKGVLLASDRGSYPYPISSNDIRSEAVTSKLKKEEEKSKHLTAQLSKQTIAMKQALKLKDDAVKSERMEKKRNEELKKELDKCRTDLEESEISVLKLRSQLEESKNSIEKMLRKQRYLENELDICENDRNKKRDNELKLEIELKKCKNELNQERKNKLELERKLEERGGEINDMKRNSRELEDELEKMTI